MASSETNFEDCLRLYWPELKHLYMELYHDEAMLKKLSDKAAFSKELTDLEELYQKTTGETMAKYYRPPQGIYSEENLKMAQEHGIRLSGPKLGRPSATAKVDKKQEYQDNTDRIEVERRFSLTKRCYGMGKIMTKLEETQLTSIALSVFVANIVRMQQRILSALFYLLGILKFKEGWLPAYAG